MLNATHCHHDAHMSFFCQVVICLITTRMRHNIRMNQSNQTSIWKTAHIFEDKKKNSSCARMIALTYPYQVLQNATHSYELSYSQRMRSKMFIVNETVEKENDHFSNYKLSGQDSSRLCIMAPWKMVVTWLKMTRNVCSSFIIRTSMGLKPPMFSNRVQAEDQVENSLFLISSTSHLGKSPHNFESAEIIRGIYRATHVLRRGTRASSESLP